MGCGVVGSSDGKLLGEGVGEGVGRRVGEGVGGSVGEDVIAVLQLQSVQAQEYFVSRLAPYQSHTPSRVPTQKSISSHEAPKHNVHASA